jgi:hypothetical protein
MSPDLIPESICFHFKIMLNLIKTNPQPVNPKQKEKENRILQKYTELLDTILKKNYSYQRTKEVRFRADQRPNHYTKKKKRVQSKVHK